MVIMVNGIFSNQTNSAAMVKKCHWCFLQRSVSTEKVGNVRNSNRSIQMVLAGISVPHFLMAVLNKVFEFEQEYANSLVGNRLPSWAHA